MGLGSSAHGCQSRPQQPTPLLPGWKNEESGRVQMRGTEAEVEERKMNLYRWDAIDYSDDLSYQVASRSFTLSHFVVCRAVANDE